MVLLGAGVCVAIIAVVIVVGAVSAIIAAAKDTLKDADEM